MARGRGARVREERADGGSNKRSAPHAKPQRIPPAARPAPSPRTPLRDCVAWRARVPPAARHGRAPRVSPRVSRGAIKKVLNSATPPLSLLSLCGPFTNAAGAPARRPEDKAVSPCGRAPPPPASATMVQKERLMTAGGGGGALRACFLCSTGRRATRVRATSARLAGACARAARAARVQR